MRKPLTWRLSKSLFLPLLFCSSVALGQEWPSRVVTIVLPWTAGGSASLLAQTVANKLSEVTRQKFIVEPRPGAGGTVGAGIVARAAPDGHTLVLSGQASHVVGPMINPVAYDPIKDVTHIGYLGGAPYMMMIHPGVQARTLREFLALARSTSGGLSIGSPGQGTLGALSIEMMRTKLGDSIVHAAYKASTPAASDVIGGHIHAALVTIVVAEPLLKAGKVRPIVTSARQRLSKYPDVPTFIEEGMPELTGNGWFGISGPAGMPLHIVHRLNLEIRKMLTAPDVVTLFERQGIETDTSMDAASFSNLVRSETLKWKPIVEKTK